MSVLPSFPTFIPPFTNRSFFINAALFEPPSFCDYTQLQKKLLHAKTGGGPALVHLSFSEGDPICVKQFAVFFLSVYIVWHSFCGIITANVAEGCIVKIREISNRLIRDSEIRKLHTAQKLRNFMACFH